MKTFVGLRADKDYYQEYVNVFYKSVVKEWNIPVANGKRIWETRRRWHLIGQLNTWNDMQLCKYPLWKFITYRMYI